jgi:hypothetical protein
MAHMAASSFPRVSAANIRHEAGCSRRISSTERSDRCSTSLSRAAQRPTIRERPEIAGPSDELVPSALTLERPLSAHSLGTRADQERALRVRFDGFAQPSGNARSLLTPDDRFRWPFEIATADVAVAIFD